MRKRTPTSIEVPANIEEFDKAQAFVEQLLERASVSREIARETKTIFDTVFSAVLIQEADLNTPLNISTDNRLGGLYLIISYEGKRFALPEEDDDDIPLELRLLEGYADKISCSYRSGYNTIRISVQKKPRTFVIWCSIGIFAAVAVYAIIDMLFGPEEQQVLLDNYVFPFEQLYANAMLMVGAPVTFFSLMKNSSDSVIASERVSHAQKLHIKSISTSIFAILLALVLCAGLTYALSDWRGYESAFAGRQIEWTFSNMIVSLIPASIFEPFETISPIPLIIVALLVTYALVSAGKDFDALKSAIDICYGVFSRMLSAVMAAIPIAFFLAVLDVLLKGGYATLLLMLAFFFFVALCCFALFATYAIRLKMRGVKLGPFAKKLMPLLRENRAIGSAIDAAPFNIRYCVKHFGMDRGRVSHILRILAQINCDANCFLLTLIAMLYIFASGMEVSIVNIVVIAAIALFLSFGAPNQPGSLLIGTLIILNYLNTYELVCMAIYMEVFLGGIQNIVNVIADIVIAAEEEGVKIAE